VPIGEDGGVTTYRWERDAAAVDWDELSALYRAAPLGDKPPDALRTVFGNSRYMAFVFDGDRLAGAGRALADGLDCSYLADVAVHPDHQGAGLGQAIIRDLVPRVPGTARSSCTPTRAPRASTPSSASSR
jgi:GNAT superfamily N-acetyltransferase